MTLPDAQHHRILSNTGHIRSARKDTRSRFEHRTSAVNKE